MPTGPARISSQSVTLSSNVSGVASSTITEAAGEIIGVQVTLGTGMLTMALTLTSDTTQVILNGITVTANGFYKPRVNATTNDGSTAITNSFVPYVSGGTITCAIASATASKDVTIKVFYR